MNSIRDLSRKPLFVLMVITLVITSYLLYKQIQIGVPYYDVFVYLNNALIFAGIPVGNVSVIYLSPLVPFLTSLVFRAGYISANAIFILGAVIFIFGVMGLYLLFKERFSQIQSLAGALIFLSFPLIFAWAVSGGIDIPGVVFSIWTVYLLVLGVKDSKYLYLVFPILMVAILARYTSIIMVFPIFLYIMINENRIKNLKNVIIGVLASFLMIVPFLLYFYTKLGNLNPLINLVTSTIMGASGAVNDLGYNPDKLYFLYNLLNYINLGPLQGVYRQIQNPNQGDPSILAYIIAIVALVGLGIYLYRILKKKIEDLEGNRNRTILHTLILIILLAVGVWSFFTSSYMISEFVFLAAFYTAYRLLKGTSTKLEVDFLFLSWFAAFFIFHSIIPLKVDRYFITMSPALAYFIILGLTTVVEKYKTRLFFKGVKSEQICLIIAIILLISTAVTFIGHAPKHGYGYHIQVASDWLTEYDPSYRDRVIFSDYDPAFRWSLKKEVEFGVPRLYVDPDSFSRYLLDHDSDYYIDALSDPKWNIPNYHIIRNMSGIAIYQRDSITS